MTELQWNGFGVDFLTGMKESYQEGMYGAVFTNFSYFFLEQRQLLSIMHDLGVSNESGTFDYTGITSAIPIIPFGLAIVGLIVGLIMFSLKNVMHKPTVLVLTRLEASPKSTLTLISVMLAGVAALLTAIQKFQKP